MLLSTTVYNIVCVTIAFSEELTHSPWVNTTREWTSEFITTPVYLSENSWDDHVTYADGFYEAVTNTSVKRNTPNYMEFSEYKAYKFFFDYFIYFTSVPGLLTNPLSIYVAVNIRPQNSSELHMIALGVTDFIVVLFRLCIHFLRISKYVWTDLSCQTLLFITNLGYVFSNWILVSWTVERFIAVVFPLKMNAWCTVSVVKKGMAVAFSVCCLVLIPQLVETSSVYNAAQKKVECIFSDAYYNKYSVFNQIVYLYAPTTVVTVCNLAIIIKVKATLKQRANYTSNRDTLSKRSREQRQMTAMLLVVAGAFFFLHLPQILATILQALYVVEKQNYDIRTIITYHLLFIVGYQITDFQNSLNFFLYCIFGNKVRKILLQKMPCRIKTNSTAESSKSIFKTNSTNL